MGSYDKLNCVIQFRICFVYTNFVMNNIRLKIPCRKLQFYLAYMSLKLFFLSEGENTHCD
jgi:hypothetical protein